MLLQLAGSVPLTLVLEKFLQQQPWYSEEENKVKQCENVY
jgi:hypothetical protein